MRGDPIPALKQEAARALVSLIDSWNRDDAAARIGVERQRLVDLRHGKLDRFSLDRLIRFLAHLGVRVELRITPPFGARAQD